MNTTADSSISDSSQASVSSSNISSCTVCTGESTGISSSTAAALNTTAQSNEVAIYLTSQGIASIFSVESTERRQCLCFHNVFNQATIFIVLVDSDNYFQFSCSNQGDLSRSSFQRSRTTDGSRNVNGVTFLAFETHLLDEVSENQIFLVRSNDFIRPNCGDERCSSRLSDVSSTESHIKISLKINYVTSGRKP